MPAKKTPAKSKALALPAKTGKRFEDSIETAGDDVEVIDDASTPTTALSTYSSVPQLDSSDLFIPKLRLGQGLSAEVASGEANIGDWLMTGSEPMKTCTVIPMLMTRRRELRDTDERAVVCRSADSLHGVGAPGGECATCPMNQWTPNKKTGKNNAPPCIFIYSYMVYILEVEEMAVLEFYRTSLPAGKMLNTIILQKGLGTFAVKLGSSLQKGGKGTFAAPSIVATKLDPKVLAKAKAKIADMGFGG
jgi:hypothetical protein